MKMALHVVLTKVFFAIGYTGQIYEKCSLKKTIKGFQTGTCGSKKTTIIIENKKRKTI
uniref:Uncharacterized protein n=1 Tax=Chlorodesmis fastigiata TaxID=189431 RepID=A0A2P0QHH9_CHLFS|nr:hypothetical protein [Chlorodesmis fastigiata]ARO74224.1 hypothetical protein [Chlorodesmis fastigiata]